MDRQVKRRVERHRFLYIYRQERRSVWFCVVPYMKAGGIKRHKRRTFQDRRYGTKAAALAVAQQWRDEQTELSEVRRAMGDQKALSLFTAVSEATPFGLVGIKPLFRLKPLGGNMSVTAQKGRKRWFSMRKYGVWEAYEMAVIQRCRWIGAEPPDRADMDARFNRWLEANEGQLTKHEICYKSLLQTRK